MRRYPAIVFLALVATPATGCNRGPVLAEVEGTVTVNGRPLDNVQVEFLPDPDKGTNGPRSTGVTDKEGRFQLHCDDQRRGAVVGHHRVIVRDLRVYEGVPLGRDDGKPLRPARVAREYADARATLLRIEVKADGQPILLAIMPP